MNEDEIFLAEARQMGKSIALMRALRRMAESSMLFIGTPNGSKAIKADPKAAERAKRYIWSRIERNEANSGRAGK